jgi:hypothetical protein
MPKLLNRTNLPNYASAPLSPANGDVYYNTTDAKMYARVNGAWVPLGDVTLTGSETLSNKTLTAPKFASAGEIDDANGNELIKFPATVASAVNEVTISNAATGSSPTISATGDDTNISLSLSPKGSSGEILATSHVNILGANFLRFSDQNNSNNVAFRAASNVAANVEWTLPSTVGTSGNYLQVTGGGTLTWAAVPTQGLTTVTTTTASFTLGTADVNKTFYCTTNAVTITTPSDATANIAVGSLIYVIRASTSTVTFVAGASATLNYTYGFTLRAQWSAATLLKSAASTWVLIGDTA